MLNLLFHYYVSVHFFWKGHSWNDLYCVGWDVKPYLLTHSLILGFELYFFWSWDSPLVYVTSFHGNVVIKKVCVCVTVCICVTGLHQQLVNEAHKRQQDMDAMSDRLASTTTELSQSSNHITALEEAIEAERASHIQTKFSCELFQVRYNTIFVICPV